MTSTVFVTGANGFIAQHVVKQLVDSGYKVIGSVRSASKGDALKANLSKNFEYEIVPDLGVKGAFVPVLKKHPEIKYFLHTALPVTFEATDPEREILLPAIDGVKDILLSINEYGKHIEKVVMTSSIVAVANFDSSPSQVVSEKDWNPITWEEAKVNGLNGYSGSKKFGEKAAWEFIKECKPSFKFSTINPAFVFGPQAFKSDVSNKLNLTNEVINSLVHLKPNDPVPGDFGWTSIDVRDVAKAHLVSIKDSNTNGERIITTNERFSSQRIIDVINEKFEIYNGKIPKGHPGDYVVTGATFDDKKSRELLGFKYIPLEKTIVDVMDQVVVYNQALNQK